MTIYETVKPELVRGVGPWGPCGPIYHHNGAFWCRLTVGGHVFVIDEFVAPLWCQWYRDELYKAGRMLTTWKGHPDSFTACATQPNRDDATGVAPTELEALALAYRAACVKEKP